VCCNLRMLLLCAGGMPDLLLWRPGEAGGAKLVEVKGPRDRLSEQQRAWLLALMNVDVQVGA
jgi:fanconi-associated nuclease 1